MIIKGAKLVITAIIIFVFSCTQGQRTVDSTLLKAFPFKIGNIGFATDSLEILIGDISRGETIQHRLAMCNFGKKPITFRSGKISTFVEMNYEPAALQPGQTGFAVIDVEVINEFPLGTAHIEVVVESSDKNSPFKFLYLIGDVVDDPLASQEQLIIDTVPRLVFNEYNYDFGHLNRGKNVVHTFLFTNMGSEDLVIDEINSSEGIRIVNPPETTIPPGSSGSLVVRMRTMGNFGVQHRMVSVFSNDPVNPVITLGVHGTVRQQAPPKQDPDFCYQ